MKRIPSNILVSPLQTEQLCYRAQERIQSMENDKAREEDRAPLTVVRVITDTVGVVKCATNGKYYALNRDGVGDSRCVCRKHPLTLGFFPEYEGGAMSMVPVLELKLDGEKLEGFLTLPAEPLETFIRTFGTRLEQNYETWRVSLEHGETVAA